ncbi:MAG: fumarylacetoacetate hydrolase family protein [Pseudomonadota bacterium]
MKIATLRTTDGLQPAVQLSGGDFLNLTTAHDTGHLKGQPIRSTKSLLDADGAAHKAVRELIDHVESNAGNSKDQLSESAALFPEASASLAAPITPGFILATGAAYRDHLEEMNVVLPTIPSGFQKVPYALAGPQDDLILPAQAPNMIDFECEFACVFSKTCHNVGEDEALDYVAGYTMINDVSDRAAAGAFIQSLSAGNAKHSCELLEEVLHGKQYPTFCPLGPVVATKDEIPDPHSVEIGTRLNGELMQSANTKDLIFKIAFVIAHFSQWYRFEPGDVLTTGSPAGVGFARDPKIFLKPGDVVEVFGGNIGSLRNTVTSAAERD